MTYFNPLVREALIFTAKIRVKRADENISDLHPNFIQLVDHRDELVRRMSATALRQFVRKMISVDKEEVLQMKELLKTRRDELVGICRFKKKEIPQLPFLQVVVSKDTSLDTLVYLARVEKSSHESAAFVVEYGEIRNRFFSWLPKASWNEIRLLVLDRAKSKQKEVRPNATEEFSLHDYELLLSSIVKLRRKLIGASSQRSLQQVA